MNKKFNFCKANTVTKMGSNDLFSVGPEMAPRGQLFDVIIIRTLQTSAIDVNYYSFIES